MSFADDKKHMHGARTPPDALFRSRWVVSPLASGEYGSRRCAMNNAWRSKPANAKEAPVAYQIVGHGEVCISSLAIQYEKAREFHYGIYYSAS